jgi:hypothetical protein
MRFRAESQWLCTTGPWDSFLEKAATAKGRAKYTPVDLDWLSKKEVNGRQVRC